MCNDGPTAAWKARVGEEVLCKDRGTWFAATVTQKVDLGGEAPHLIVNREGATFREVVHPENVVAVKAPADPKQRKLF